MLPETPRTHLRNLLPTWRRPQSGGSVVVRFLSVTVTVRNQRVCNRKSDHHQTSGHHTTLDILNTKLSSAVCVRATNNFSDSSCLRLHREVLVVCLCVILPCVSKSFGHICDRYLFQGPQKTPASVRCLRNSWPRTTRNFSVKQARRVLVPSLTLCTAWVSGPRCVASCLIW